MRIIKRSASKKLFLILTLLLAGLSVSALTRSDALFGPSGLLSGAFFGPSATSITPIASAPAATSSNTAATYNSFGSMLLAQTIVDDQGADDEPGQKDLNSMAVDFGASGSTTFDVFWNWDDTATSGANTRDGGALFDTDGDGFANYSLYITVLANGQWNTQLFVCTADNRADRCAGPDEVDPADFDSTASVSVVEDSDPFGFSGSPYFTTAHLQNNDCDNNPECNTDDTVADVLAVLSDFGNPADIRLLNVCSYPSGEPNSDPSDCVVENPPGYLTLVKVVDNFGESGAGYKGVGDFPLTINGNSTTSGSEVTVVAGDHTIAETAQAGYSVGTWTCTDGTNGTAGSASATVNVASGESVTCTMTNTLIANPAIDLVKTAQTFFSTPPVAGDKITYTFQITNTGNVTLSGVDLDDTLLAYSNVTCGSTTLAPGASTSCNADYFLTQANVDAGAVANTATACGDPPTGAGSEVCDSDGTNTPITQVPNLSILKSANPTTYDSVGDEITYTITVTNTGNVTLNNVTVTDPGVDGLTCIPANGSSLAPLAVMTCTATHTITQADLDNGSYLNTACVDDGAGGAAQKCDDETVTGDQDPELQIVKSANPTTYDSVGDVITYTITVTNIGNITLNNVAVTDALVTNLDCDPITAGNQTSGFTLAPLAVLTCSATHTIIQADLDNGTFANTACVDDGAGGAVEKCDDETVTGDQNPELSIVKSANPTTYNAPGQVITYTITVTNIGNVTLASVTVTDPGVDGLTCIPANGSSLAPLAVMTCTATHTITQGDIDGGSYLNTACADDGAGGAAQVCDPETVTAIQNPQLAVDKTADVTLIISAGQLITYSYVVTNTGNVTLTGITLTDNKLGSITCPKTSLVPAEFMTCTATYTTVASDLGLTSLDNVATADSDQTDQTTDNHSIPVAPPDVSGNTYPTGKEPCEFANDPEGNTSEGPLTLLYKLNRNSTIKSVSPANFFFYGYLTASTTGTQTVVVEQSNDANLPNMLAVQATVYRASNCNSQVTSGPVPIDSTASSVQFSFDGVSGVEYIIKVQYKPSPLIGYPFNTGGANYEFLMSLDGSSDADDGGTPLVFAN